MPSPLRVLALAGSARIPSYTASLVRAATSALLVAAEFHVDEINLAQTRYPFCDPAFHHESDRHPDPEVRRLVALATDADAFLLATPVYHNSYSGLLKNALDHLAIVHFQEKPVGLLGHGGRRTTQAVDHLRIVVRGLGGLAVPAQVCTANEDYAIAPDAAGTYRISSADINRRLERFAGELARVTNALAAQRAVR